MYNINNFQVDASVIRFYNKNYNINCRIVDSEGKTLTFPSIFTDEEKPELAKGRHYAAWDFEGTLEDLKEKIKDLRAFCQLCNGTYFEKVHLMEKAEEDIRQILGDLLYVSQDKENEDED